MQQSWPEILMSILFYDAQTTQSLQFGYEMRRTSFSQNVLQICVNTGHYNSLPKILKKSLPALMRNPSWNNSIHSETGMLPFSFCRITI